MQQAVVGLDGVRSDEPGGASLLTQRHAGLLQLGASDGMPGHLVDDFVHPHQQLAVVQRTLAWPYAVPGQVPRLTAEPGCLCQYAYRDRAVTGGHPAHLLASDQCCVGAQLRRPQRGNDASRSTADHDDVDAFRDGHGSVRRDT